MRNEGELKPTSSLRMAWVTAAMIAGVSLLFLFAVVPHFGRGEPAAPGSTAPEFRLSRLDGAGELGLRDLEGKVVVIDFWASWCEPCEAQARVLGRALERRRGQPFTVLGVATGDRLEAARAAAARHAYPSVFDADGAVAAAYGVGQGAAAASGGLPTLVVIDRAQKVVAVREGAVDEPTLERLIAEAGR